MRQISPYLLGILLSLVAFSVNRSFGSERPNIVFILADDLGWSDVGWHGSNIRTPHLDRLASKGAKLEQFYVMPVCSPTRAALMTGRHPIRHGLQLSVVRPWAQYGLPLSERTLGQSLQDVGYTTAIIGKWHLGHFHPDYLPTRRGFDHQYGLYNGMIDYFTHLRDGGHDWHRNDQACYDEGYSTQLIGDEAVRLIEGQEASKPLFLYVPFNAPHSPLQVPKEYREPYASISDEKRQLYCAMVACLDEQVGKIASAVEARGWTNKTLFIFSSDNGGPTSLGATNGSLKSGKGYLYEGGIRVPAFATWPGVIAEGSVIDEPLHIVDWYPTLTRLTGGSMGGLALDGLDMWGCLTRKQPSPHEEILLNALPSGGAIRRGDWKLVVNGRVDANNLEKANVPLDADPESDLLRVCDLFNLAIDPNEKHNVVSENPEVAKNLFERLRHYMDAAVPPRAESVPKNFPSPRVWGETTN